MYAYTGSYKNVPVTVFAHGMGIPSMGIYSYELFHFYDVNMIIRLGSCGSFRKEINVGDVVVAKDVISHSIYAEEIGLDVKGKLLSIEPNLLSEVLSVAKENNIKIDAAKVACSTAFYTGATIEQQMKRYDNPDVIEMEAHALYANAIKCKKKAVCLLTVSDSFVTKKEMTSLERQNSLAHMCELGLELAIHFQK
jgi:purine-nucleoside phosphorylase